MKVSTNAIGGTNATSQTPDLTAVAGAGSTSQGLDKNAFLSLLVTQLKNQDPTSPQDDSAFAAQLAQFSSLEQLQQANQTLTQIDGYFGAAASAAGASTSEGKV